MRFALEMNRTRSDSCVEVQTARARLMLRCFEPDAYRCLLVRRFSSASSAPVGALNLIGNQPAAKGLVSIASRPFGWHMGHLRGRHDRMNFSVH
jgi:hypothetical protein